MEIKHIVPQGVEIVIGQLYLKVIESEYALAEREAEPADLEEVEQLKKDYAACKGRVAELESKLAQCLESTADDSARAKAELARLNKNLDYSEKALADARRATARKSNEVDELQDKLAETIKRCEEYKAQLAKTAQSASQSRDAAVKAEGTANQLGSQDVLAERDKLRQTVERLQGCITTSSNHLRRASMHWESGDDEKAYRSVTAAWKLLSKNTTKESEK